MAAIDIDYGKMMAQTTITVNLIGFNKTWEARIFLAVWLFSIGAWVLGTKLEIESK